MGSSTTVDVAYAEPLIQGVPVNGYDFDDSDGEGGCLYSLVWVALLSFVAWPASAAVASLWCLLEPFEAVIDIFQTFNRFLEQVVTWPRACGRAIIDGTPEFPTILDRERAQEDVNAQDLVESDLPRAASKGGRFVCSLFWAALLFYIAWPVSWFCVSSWLLLQPFEAVFMMNTSCLEKLSTWPRACGHAIILGQSTVPFPN